MTFEYRALRRTIEGPLLTETERQDLSLALRGCSQAKRKGRAKVEKKADFCGVRNQTCTLHNDFLCS